MNKFWTIVAAIFVGLAVVSFAPSAKAEECGYGTAAELNEQLSAIENIHTYDFTEAEVAAFEAAKGRPPNATEGKIEIKKVETDAVGGLFFTQNGCFINRIGPMNLDQFRFFLGGLLAQKVD